MNSGYNGLVTTCDVFLFNNGDTSNRNGYGTCDIQHGQSINWSMASGVNYGFDFVPNFAIATGVQTRADADAIARYYYEANGVQNFLWATCELTHRDANRGDSLGSMGEGPYGFMWQGFGYFGPVSILAALI